LFGIHQVERANVFGNCKVAALDIKSGAIKYPLARELFAFGIRELRVGSRIRFALVIHGPAQRLNSSCKNFVDDYNATPSLKGNDCQKENVEVGTWFWCVGGFSL
jgi:hypothetical protein